MRTQTTLLATIVLWACITSCQTADDPFRWLEDVDGEQALAWVEAHNEQTLTSLQNHPAFDTIYRRSLEIYHSEEAILPWEVRGDFVYDLLQEEQHARGVWRRAPLESYLEGEPDWEVVLDLDALSQAEGENWVFKGAQCLPPAYARCMFRLSRGGSDAAEIREFDVERKAFVEDGFFLPEARTFYEWKDTNALYVATDFGEGTTTESGLPQVVKEWERGTPLKQAKIIFETDSRGAWVFPWVERAGGRSYALIIHKASRYETILFALNESQLRELRIPGDARIRIHPGLGMLVILLKSDWTVGGATYPEGALLCIDYERFLAGYRNFELVFTPQERAHVFSFSVTESLLLVSILRDATRQLYRYRRENGHWILDPVDTPEHVNTYHTGQVEGSDQFFLTSEGFLTPPTLSLAREDGTVIRVEQQEPQFDAGPYTVGRIEATSADGTLVPYFIVHRRDMVFDGQNPTLLHGFGGYGMSRVPYYDPVLGAAWLERGGVYVLANIRGGGEFGPSWHRAALREHRQRAFDDFIAVAEDVIARSISSPKHLGIMGHSNGGLLVGAVLTQRPELFNAAVALNPLLDLSRVSDRDELGDAKDPNDWEYMRKYSPYHNVSPRKTYPKALFVTARTDDRAPPGDARKMAARMEETGHSVYFYEAKEGGHGGGVTPHQRALRNALIFTYLLDQLR